MPRDAEGRWAPRGWGSLAALDRMGLFLRLVTPWAFLRLSFFLSFPMEAYAGRMQGLIGELVYYFGLAGSSVGKTREPSTVLSLACSDSPDAIHGDPSFFV